MEFAKLREAYWDGEWDREMDIPGLGEDYNNILLSLRALPGLAIARKLNYMRDIAFARYSGTSERDPVCESCGILHHSGEIYCLSMYKTEEDFVKSKVMYTAALCSACRVKLRKVRNRLK